MKVKSPKEFLTATDALLDRNGYLSICTDCIDDLFEKIFASENDLSKTILQLCRMLNVVYLDGAVQATITHAATLTVEGKSLRLVFSYYKSKATSMAHMNQSGALTFTEPVILVSDKPPDENIKDIDYYKQFWGENFEIEDYDYLEKELADWEKTHKSDTKAELILLKEICLKELEIRKSRARGSVSEAALKTLQDLMKTASVDPSKTSMANAGKSLDTFSSFIKNIEETEPADLYKDKDLFKDFDNIDFYFKKYVTRPLKNFITQSRDFNVSVEDDVDEIVEEGYEEDEKR
jgi:hypothetical protein